jgi:hypothetical protein
MGLEKSGGVLLLPFGTAPPMPAQTRRALCDGSRECQTSVLSRWIRGRKCQNLARTKRVACNSGFNCLRNTGDFNAWNAISGSPSSGVEQAQIQLDSAQIELGFAQSPRLRFSVGSHKVCYAKCLNLLETGPLAICHRDLRVEASRQTLIEQE